MLNIHVRAFMWVALRVIAFQACLQIGALSFIQRLAIFPGTLLFSCPYRVQLVAPQYMLRVVKGSRFSSE
jgi:flagellar biosynthesis protein FliQ